VGGGILADSENDVSDSSSKEQHNVFLSNDQRPDILLEEYKIHKQETLQHLGVLQRQSSYIQLSGAVLLTLVIYIYGKPDGFNLSEIPKTFQTAALIGAAVLLFYLSSSVATASYSILVLRRRMAWIEQRINELSNETLLTYESFLSRRFHESPTLSDGTITPHAMSGLWRIVLFSGASLLLIVLGLEIIPPGWSIFYSVTVGYISIIQIINYEVFFTPYGQKVMDDTIALGDAEVARGPRRIGYHLFNLLTFILFAIIFFGDIREFHDPLSRMIDGAIILVGQYSDWQVLAGIAVFTFLCAIGLPAPSEAPLLLVSSLGGPSVYLASAIGKGLGSAFLGLLVYLSLSRRGRVLDGIRNYRDQFHRGWIGSKLNGGLKDVIYFACQAIPFAPMRSSTMIYSGFVNHTKRTLLIVFAISAIGTMVRMFLVSYLANDFLVSISPGYGP
jgi:hypothetical protein